MASRCEGFYGVEDDLSELLARFEAAMRLGGLGQRVGPVDDRAQLAAEEELRGPQQLGLSAHVRAKQRELPAEQDAQVDPRVVAGGGAAGDQPAAARQAT